MEFLNRRHLDEGTLKYPATDFWHPNGFAHNRIINQKNTLAREYITQTVCGYYRSPQITPSSSWPTRLIFYEKQQPVPIDSSYYNIRDGAYDVTHCYTSSSMYGANNNFDIDKFFYNSSNTFYSDFDNKVFACIRHIVQGIKELNAIRTCRRPISVGFFSKKQTPRRSFNDNFDGIDAERQANYNTTWCNIIQYIAITVPSYCRFTFFISDTCEWFDVYNVIKHWRCNSDHQCDRRTRNEPRCFNCSPQCRLKLVIERTTFEAGCRPGVLTSTLNEWGEQAASCMKSKKHFVSRKQWSTFMSLLTYKHLKFVFFCKFVNCIRSMAGLETNTTINFRKLCFMASSTLRNLF